MKTKKRVDAKTLQKLTKHLILAAKKLTPKEKKQAPEFLIKRTFPTYPIIPKPQTQIIKEKLVQEQPSQEEIFNIGKITKFTMDKTIDLIECAGADLPIKIKKESHTFVTDIKLTEKEINDVIEKFSKEAKVPISQVFRANARGFIITAIVSSTGSRFIMQRIRS
ncbi:MAG: hypothetical protein QW041_00015 [Candidatus Pacearchaeota archaeon]